jgi:hypothetical protein
MAAPVKPGRQSVPVKTRALAGKKEKSPYS